MPVRAATGYDCRRIRTRSPVCVCKARVVEDLSKEIRDCQLQAIECRRRANKTRDRISKEGYLDMEQRWLALAHSYQMVEWLATRGQLSPGSMEGSPSSQTMRRRTRLIGTASRMRRGSR